MLVANDLNQCSFIGRLGADPELKNIPSGKSVCNMRIACGRSWKVQDGQKEERTEWVSIVVWGKLAEICGQYLKKGSRIYISGRLETRKWQGKDGQDRYTTEVVVDGFQGVMQMLGSKHDSAPARAALEPAATPGPPLIPGQQQPGPREFDDHVPF